MRSILFEITPRAVLSKAADVLRERFVLPCNLLIAFATLVLESFAIQYFDFSAAIFDKSVTLKRARRLIDASTPYCQHLSEKLLCKQELRTLNAIHSHQQPARATLQDPMARVTDHAL